MSEKTVIEGLFESDLETLAEAYWLHEPNTKQEWYQAIAFTARSRGMHMLATHGMCERVRCLDYTLWRRLCEDLASLKRWAVTNNARAAFIDKALELGRVVA